MNEQLFLRYQDNFTNLIRERYLLDNKTHNFDDYDIEDFKFEDLDFYCEEKKIKPFIKLLIALTIICPLLVIFIPSKETIIAMYIANMVTPDNLNFANEVFKSNLKDYMDIISGALNK